MSKTAAIPVPKAARGSAKTAEPIRARAGAPLSPHVRPTAHGWVVVSPSLGARAEALKADVEEVRAWATQSRGKSRPTSTSKTHVRTGPRDRLAEVVLHHDIILPDAATTKTFAEVEQSLAAALSALADRLARSTPAISREVFTTMLHAAELRSRASTLRLEALIDALAARLAEATATPRASPARAPSREIELLSASAIGEALGLTESTVYQRERKRQLFGYLPGQRERGRVYPSFQLWEHVQGEPLERILRTLGDKPSGQDATFFAAINPDLLGSTPVEVLIGERLTEREDEEQAQRLLTLEPQRRLDAVLAAAEKFAAAGR